MNILLVGKSISTEVVLENIMEFYKSIVLFDKTAHQLMKMMSEKFNIDINNSRELFELKTKRSNRQRGEINDQLNYHFHGAQCSFENKITDQFSDVKINNGLAFGIIHSYYLLKFINTSKLLKKAKQVLSNQAVKMRKVLEVLKSSEYLIEYSNNSNTGFIINKKTLNKKLN